MHRKYTSLGQAYRTFLASLPRPPDGSALNVILLNEPNVCGEWQCGDGAGIYLAAHTMAAEAASCLQLLLTAPDRSTGLLATRRLTCNGPIKGAVLRVTSPEASTDSIGAAL